MKFFREYLPEKGTDVGRMVLDYFSRSIHSQVDAIDDTNFQAMARLKYSNQYSSWLSSLHLRQ